MILVVGATGMLGSEICRRLVARGAPVRALVRTTADPARVAALEGLGADIAHGDLRDRASLDAACRGVSGVVTTATSFPSSYEPRVNDIATTDLAGTEQLIDAAVAAGVADFVFTSISENIRVDVPFIAAKRAVEAYLRESGLRHTILHSSCYQEVWLGPALGFDLLYARATVYGGGTAPISWIAAGDVAEIAARSLDTPAAWSATLEVGGPEALGPLDVVAIFERVGGRPFEVVHVPEEALRTQLAAASDPFERSFAGLLVAAAAGDAVDGRRTLDAMPIRLRSVEEYAESVLGRVPAGVGGGRGRLGVHPTPDRPGHRRTRPARSTPEGRPAAARRSPSSSGGSRRG